VFDHGSQSNLISTQLVEKLGPEMQDYPQSYPLGWVRRDAELNISKQCKFKFAINRTTLTKWLHMWLFWMYVESSWELHTLM
jgi:hypothetical protein